MMSALPNPFKDDSGINTDVQIAKNATKEERKQLVEFELSNNDESRNTNNAETISIKNINTEAWLIILLVFMSGLAIPTYSQKKMIDKLKEDLKFERNFIRPETRQA